MFKDKTIAFVGAGAMGEAMIRGLLSQKIVSSDQIIAADPWQERIKELQEKYDVIGDIRGPGLFIGIELVKDPKSREPFTELLEEMLLEGVKQNIFFGSSMPYLSGTGKILMRNLIKIKPPIIITEDDADFICDKFESVLKASLNNLKHS